MLNDITHGLTAVKGYLRVNIYLFKDFQRSSNMLKYYIIYSSLILSSGILLTLLWFYLNYSETIYLILGLLGETSYLIFYIILVRTLSVRDEIMMKPFKRLIYKIFILHIICLIAEWCLLAIFLLNYNVDILVFPIICLRLQVDSLNISTLNLESEYEELTGFYVLPPLYDKVGSISNLEYEIVSREWPYLQHMHQRDKIHMDKLLTTVFLLMKYKLSPHATEVFDVLLNRNFSPQSNKLRSNIKVIFTVYNQTGIGKYNGPKVFADKTSWQECFRKAREFDISKMPKFEGVKPTFDLIKINSYLYPTIKNKTVEVIIPPVPKIKVVDSQKLKTRGTPVAEFRKAFLREVYLKSFNSKHEPFKWSPKNEYYQRTADGIHAHPLDTNKLIAELKKATPTIERRTVKEVVGMTKFTDHFYMLRNKGRIPRDYIVKNKARQPIHQRYIGSTCDIVNTDWCKKNMIKQSQPNEFHIMVGNSKDVLYNGSSKYSSFFNKFGRRRDVT